MTTVLHPSLPAFYLKHYGISTLVGLAFLGVMGIIYVNGPYEVMSLGYILGAVGALILLAGAAHTAMHKGSVRLLYDAEQITYERGILHKSKTSVPLSRITDTAIGRTFLDTVMGIGTLKINTGGSATYEIEAQDFPYDDIDTLNRDLIKHLHAKGAPAKP